MTKKIEETLRKIAADTSKASLQTSSNIELPSRHDLPGDPECPHCHGIGYLRLDLPLGHPDFGRVRPCFCLEKRISQYASQRLYALSNLEELSHLTFETFAPRGRINLPSLQADSLERAYNNCRIFAQSLKGWLLLQGRVGCGKTHLAAAIANFTASLGVPTLFITVPDMLDTLRAAFDDPETTFADQFEQIKTVALLILDDFGTQNATAWAQEKLFQVINYRYTQKLPLVVTTNLPLDSFEDRIRSRLMDRELVTREEILAPDYRDPMDDWSQDRIYSLANFKKLTFGNFSDRRDENLAEEDLKNLDKAFRAAQQFSENPKGWLVFSGPYSCGKTHLAAAIANYRASMGDFALFVNVSDLLDYLRATFSPDSKVRFDKRFDEVKTASLLILDDLGAHPTSPWAREKLWQIIDYRYFAEKPTVFTTSLTIDDMAKVEPRLLSRMLDARLCTIYGINVPSYTGRARKRPPRIKHSG